MKKNIGKTILFFGAVALGTMLHASQESSGDEKVLMMLKQLNTVNQKQDEILLPPASAEDQEFAKKSQEYEKNNKETEMLSARVQSDLAFEQKLPRAISYSKIGNQTVGVIEFTGKRFRLNVGDEMAGWTIKKITQDGIYMQNRDGYSFKSHFDTKQQQ